MLTGCIAFRIHELFVSLPRSSQIKRLRRRIAPKPSGFRPSAVLPWRLRLRPHGFPRLRLPGLCLVCDVIAVCCTGIASRLYLTCSYCDPLVVDGCSEAFLMHPILQCTRKCARCRMSAAISSGAVRSKFRNWTSCLGPPMTFESGPHSQSTN